MKLGAIWVYPVKSARGIPVGEARVERRGLAGDRRWMIVDADDRFVSQRDDPRLVHIRPTPLPGADGGLLLEAADMPPLRVAPPGPGAVRRRVRVWNDTVDAAPAGYEADAWLNRLLATEYRLVYLPDDSVRAVDPRYGRPGDEVSFADGYPLLLAGDGSLDELNRRLNEPVPMIRFRPNLVVEGSSPFDEDRWARIRIGEVAFRVVKPCARCVVTTIDPDTAVAGREPLRTLARFRNKEGKVYFGQNLIPDGSGTLRPGDTVEVLDWKPALFP